jgi:hypothetical protein
VDQCDDCDDVEREHIRCRVWPGDARRPVVGCDVGCDARSGTFDGRGTFQLLGGSAADTARGDHGDGGQTDPVASVWYTLSMALVQNNSK